MLSTIHLEIEMSFQIYVNVKSFNKMGVKTSSKPLEPPNQCNASIGKGTAFCEVWIERILRVLAHWQEFWSLPNRLNHSFRKNVPLTVVEEIFLIES